MPISNRNKSNFELVAAPIQESAWLCYYKSVAYGNLAIGTGFAEKNRSQKK